MPRRATNTPAKVLFNDAAITTRNQDLLERTDFARAIGAALKGWKQRESLVVALNGGWGSGKTSLKNLALETLRSDRKRDRPLIVEFNPWQVSGQEQITRAFFDEVGAALASETPGAADSERAKTWRDYSDYLAIGGQTASALAKILPFLGAGFLSPLLDGVAAAGKNAAEASMHADEGVSRNASTPGLHTLKAALAAELSKRRRSVLVVIDDIDRLTAEEICLLFRLVKSNADFPNFIYLLLFERRIVTAALEKIAAGRGEAFLEKIVQVNFDVPEISAIALRDIVAKEFSALIDITPGAASLFEEMRWHEIFDDALLPYFENLRAARRFTNSFRFHWTLFARDRTFEANPVDLFALEVLRVFENDLYRQLPRYKSILTGEQEPLFGRQQFEEEGKESMDRLLVNAPESHRKRTTKLINAVFPNNPLNGISYSSGALIQQLHVGHPRTFDLYFRLTLPSGTLTRGEVEEVIAATSDLGEFTARLRQYITRGHFGALLERLDASRAELFVNRIIVVQAFLDISDEVSKPSAHWVHDNDAFVMSNLTRACLLSESDGRRRTDWLLDAIARSSGLQLAIRIVTNEALPKFREAFSKGEHLVPDDRLSELARAAAMKFNQLQETILPRVGRDLSRMLHLWSLFGSIQEPMAWLTKRLNSLDLLSVLDGFSEEKEIVPGDRLTEVNMRELERYFPIDEWENAVRRIDLTTLNADHSVTLKNFDQSLEFYRSAKARG